MSQMISDRKRGFLHLARGVVDVCDRGEAIMLAAPLLFLAAEAAEYRLRAPAVLQGGTTLVFIVAFFAALFTLGTLERRYEARELARERAADLKNLSEEEQRDYLRAEQGRGPSAGTQDATTSVSDAPSF